MKVLYESIIGRRERDNLGGYYTPDWLAERIVTEVIADPLHDRALDPGCGSGTFLFHAIRHYLAAADADGLSNEDAIRGATEHVIGLDLHPLAVTFARVTYLLAIGMERLAARRGPFSVRVYLGDSLLRRARRSTAWCERNREVVGAMSINAPRAHLPAR